MRQYAIFVASDAQKARLRSIISMAQTRGLLDDLLDDVERYFARLPSILGIENATVSHFRAFGSPECEASVDFKHGHRDSIAF